MEKLASVLGFTIQEYPKSNSFGVWGKTLETPFIFEGSGKEVMAFLLGIGYILNSKSTEDSNNYWDLLDSLQIWKTEPASMKDLEQETQDLLIKIANSRTVHKSPEKKENQK